MKKSIIIILAVVAILVIWAVSVYNGLVTMDENVTGQWANVETQYQRRADLIPNLVNTVKGYATHEKETLEGVVAARSQATAIEKNNAHASFIAKVAKELKTDALALIRGDVFRYLNSAPKQSFDFIFADPPYALPELPEIPALVFERDLLRDGGIFIMEHPKTNDFSSLPYFYQHRVYGSVNFSIFLKEGEKTDA